MHFVPFSYAGNKFQLINSLSALTNAPDDSGHHFQAHGQGQGGNLLSEPEGC